MILFILVGLLIGLVPFAMKIRNSKWRLDNDFNIVINKDKELLVQNELARPLMTFSAKNDALFFHKKISFSIEPTYDLTRSVCNINGTRMFPFLNFYTVYKDSIAYREIYFDTEEFYIDCKAGNGDFQEIYFRNRMEDYSGNEDKMYCYFYKSFNGEVVWEAKYDRNGFKHGKRLNNLSWELHTDGWINALNEFRVAGIKVVGTQQQAIPDLQIEATEADRNERINRILATMRTHGLIAT